MLKITIAIIIMFAVILPVYSCNDDSVTQPKNEFIGILGDPAIAEIEINNAGQIHNEALYAFHKRHNLLCDKKLTTDEFISFSVESINEVAIMNDIPAVVTRRDAKIVLSLFAWFRDEGIYDFFNTEDNIPLDNIFNYFEDNGLFNVTESRHYLYVLNNVNNNRFIEHDIDLYINKLNNENSNELIGDDIFIDILFNSYNFWKQLEENENEKPSVISNSSNVKSDIIPGKLYDLREKGKDLSDVLGCMTGLLYFKNKYSSIAVAYFASIAFTTVYDHADWFQFGPYNHYHTR